MAAPARALGFTRNGVPRRLPPVSSLTAYDRGYYDGRRNFHTSGINYFQAEDWIRYLAGWRKAQREHWPDNRLPIDRLQMNLFEQGG